ncbi:MAG: response regulator [Bacteroidia bacterium]|nr:response regulator [Bacteroidia bacterium]
MILSENPQALPQAPGKGIGLALTKSLAELHHGTITVKSQQGHGSTFEVCLGVHASSFAPEQITASEPQYTNPWLTPGTLNHPLEDSDTLPTKPTKNLPSVLLIEDNPELNRFITQELSGLFNIYSAPDGRDGWQQCLNKNPDVVVSDIMMPHMNGIELCRQIKADERTSHLLVILLTAKTTLEDQMLGLRYGADDYILKPFSIELLRLKISNLISTRRNFQQKLIATGGVLPKMTSGSDRDRELVQKAYALVERLLANMDLNAETMAKELGLSRSLLYNKMKGLTGQSVNEFIKSIRLHKASHLIIRYPDTPIAEIALLVGFTNQSHFTRCFKEQFGVPPSQYFAENLRVP